MKAGMKFGVFLVAVKVSLFLSACSGGNGNVPNNGLGNNNLGLTPCSTLTNPNFINPGNPLAWNDFMNYVRTCQFAAYNGWPAGQLGLLDTRQQLLLNLMAGAGNPQFLPAGSGPWGGNAFQFTTGVGNALTYHVVSLGVPLMLNPVYQGANPWMFGNNNFLPMINGMGSWQLGFLYGRMARQQLMLNGNPVFNNGIPIYYRPL